MPTVSETRINKITVHLDRLVDWMVVNKPQNKIIHLYPEDYTWLKKGDPILSGRGFVITKEAVWYRSFLLLRNGS